jgi:hypothetical protein
LEVTWSVVSEAAVNGFISTGTCPTTILVNDPGCDTSAQFCLTPGTYYFVVGATVFEGFPCPGFTYQATLSVTPVADCGAQQGECAATGSCGAQAPSGCWCDEDCCGFSDCCAFKQADCGGCSP